MFVEVQIHRNTVTAVAPEANGSPGGKGHSPENGAPAGKRVPVQVAHPWYEPVKRGLEVALALVLATRLADGTPPASARAAPRAAWNACQ